MFNFFFKRKPKEERPAPGEKPAQTLAQKSPQQPPQKPNDPMATVAPAAVEASAAAIPKKSPGKPGTAAPAEEGLKAGQTLSAPGLGDFLIHDIKGGVGKSGMGVVYIVLDESSMTPFAVKTFQQWCIGTPALVQRFLREVETWIKLEQHQNIVRAFYVSTINNQPHLFLEYVAGSDLRKKIATGPLPVRDASRYQYGQLRADLRIQIGEFRRNDLEMLIEPLLRALGRKGALAGQHLIEHDAEGVNIRAMTRPGSTRASSCGSWDGPRRR